MARQNAQDEKEREAAAKEDARKELAPENTEAQQEAAAKAEMAREAEEEDNARKRPEKFEELPMQTGVVKNVSRGSLRAIRTILQTVTGTEVLLASTGRPQPSQEV